ncbi:MAG TPA: response regulator [Nevskiaceae bacterium]|nr:response regulator [Nevskiaceae bacterium]
MSEQSKTPMRELLLVDDSPADVRLAREALRESHAKFSMTVINGGEQALAWLVNRAEHDPDAAPVLVLLDMNMPKWDGETTLRNIRGHAKVKSTPVVFLTCNYEPDTKRVDAVGANAYVWKPDTLSGLTKFFASLDSFWYEHLVRGDPTPDERGAE